MRTVAIVQCRLGSARLPAKALRALGGRPMLDHVIERACAIEGVDEVIFATSVTEQDRAILAVGAARGLQTFRGSEWDVLDRMVKAARWAEADVIVRLTGDCPLLAPDVAVQVLALYWAQRRSVGGVYAWNDTARSGWPDGMDVEVFDLDLLERAADRTTDKESREHVTPQIRRLARQLLTLPSPRDLSRVKLSVDRLEDFETVTRVASFLNGDLRWPATAQACVAAGLIEQSELER